MGVNKMPGRTLETYKGYKIFDSRSYNSKGVITKSTLCVLGKKKKKLGDKFKNKEEAKAFIDTL